MSFTFETVDVKQELVTMLREELQNLGYTGKNTIKVLKADPQSPSELPCIGINRADDAESNQSLADGQGELYDPATKEYKTLYGTFFSEALEIRVWHTNGDERESLYLAVKSILFAMRSSLVAKGVLNITLRSGRDEQDSSMTQAPMVLYWASITMSYLNPLDVQFVDTVEPITDFTDNGMITEA